jgi:predicted DNA-binding transcriptional regulator YafY
MNRTDRLLALVLELQARGRCRGEDLAARFEVSVRTIYRDMLALCEAGVPVISTPGRGYELAEGYFLPPLRFTPDEATMLLLGSDVMLQSFDSEYRMVAEAAARKIAAVLPEATRTHVNQLREGLHFIESRDSDATNERLRLLRRAILANRSIRFSYHARQSADGPNQHSERSADPYALARIEDSWYLVAYCHLRQGIRNFRVSRINNLRLISQTFERPAELSLGPDNSERHEIVEVLIDHHMAAWVEESRFYYIEQREPHPEGLLVTLRVRQLSDSVPWILGWGKHARVLRPAALHDLLREELQQIMQHYPNRS